MAQYDYIHKRHNAKGKKWSPLAKYRKTSHTKNAQKNEARTKVYEDRAMNLAVIGFKTYADYLKSELWAVIRQQVLKNGERCCCLCAALATQVHHRDYSQATLLGQCLQRLAPLCGNHHRSIEFRDGDFKKLSLKQANAKLDAAIAARKPREA